MNAHKFVAEHGIEEAKRVLELASDAWAYDAEQDCFFDGSDLQDGYLIEHCNGCFLVEELKQMVDSIYMVGDFGTLDKAKKYAVSDYTAPEVKHRLEKAIADYELVESYKSSNSQAINHSCVSDFQENESQIGLSIKQNRQVEVLDMVDVSPRCEVRNG